MRNRVKTHPLGHALHDKGMRAFSEKMTEVMGHAFLRAPKFVTFASPQALRASFPRIPAERGDRLNNRCPAGKALKIARLFG